MILPLPLITEFLRYDLVGNGSFSLFSKRIYVIGDSPWMFSNFYDAIDAANVIPPSGNDRALFLFCKAGGKIVSTTPYLIPGFSIIIGMNDSSRLENTTTNLFEIQGESTFFYNLLIEGSNNPNICAFECNNQNAIHISHVKMLSNQLSANGPNRQVFLNQSGTTFKILNIEHCIIDSYLEGNNSTPQYVFNINNTNTGSVRDCDIWFNDVFSDTFQLTAFGGNVRLFGIHDARFRNCEFRGNSFHTGIRHNKGVPVGTPKIRVNHSYLEGGVPIFTEVGTDIDILNVDCFGSSLLGTSITPNSRT